MTRITATHASVHIQRVQREPDGPTETIATLSLIGPGMTRRDWIGAASWLLLFSLLLIGG